VNSYTPGKIEYQKYPCERENTKSHYKSGKIIEVMTASEVNDPNTTHRGRPRIPRQIDQTVTNRCYSPDCFPDEAGMVIRLLPEEVELLKLIDVEGLMQEEAASVLGVSRRTVWRDIHAARKKVADAIITGKSIEIAGCRRAGKGLCPRDCPKFRKKQEI